MSLDALTSLSHFVKYGGGGDGSPVQTTTVTPVSSEHSEPSVSETWWSERKKQKENAESDFETTLNQADKWEWPFLSDGMISDWRSLSLGCSAASLGLCRRQGNWKSNQQQQQHRPLTCHQFSV